MALIEGVSDLSSTRNPLVFVRDGGCLFIIDKKGSIGYAFAKRQGPGGGERGDAGGEESGVANASGAYEEVKGDRYPWLMGPEKLDVWRDSSTNVFPMDHSGVGSGPRSAQWEPPKPLWVGFVTFRSTLNMEKEPREPAGFD
jgi:hypothetical protein